MAYAVSYLGRMNLAIAIPSMQHAGIASLKELGLAGSLYFWCYGVGELLNGFLGDLLPVRVMIFVGLMLSAGMNMAVALFPSPVLIMIFWSLNGFFLSMLWGPIVRLIGEHAPDSKQGIMSMLMNMSLGAGSFISWFALGRTIDTRSDWRFAFWIPALVGIVMALAWLLLCPNARKSTIGIPAGAVPNANADIAPAGSGQEKPGVGAGRREAEAENAGGRHGSFWESFWRSRLYLIILAGMAQGMAKDGLTLWLPTLMKARYPEVPETDLVNFISLIPMFNALGILFVAVLMRQRSVNYRRISIMLFAIAVLDLLLVVFFKLPFTLTLLAFCILSLLIALINSFLLGLVPMRFAKTRRVSTVAGLLDFFAYLAAGLFSFISGSMLESGPAELAGQGGLAGGNRIFVFLLIEMIFGALVMIPAPPEIDE